MTYDLTVVNEVTVARDKLPFTSKNKERVDQRPLVAFVLKTI